MADSRLLRVAVDSGFSAEALLRNNQHFGVSRAVDAFLKQLVRHEGIELTLTGLCGDDLAYRSYISHTFGKQNYGTLGIKSIPTMSSRLGLKNLYDHLLPVYSDMRLKNRSPRTVREITTRFLMTILKRLDVRPSFRPAEFDLFFSTFAPLPDRSMTGDLPRVIMIYDLIPLTHPEFCSPVQTAYMETIIKSVEAKRDFVICNSDYVRQEIQKALPLPEKHLFVVPLGVEPTFLPVVDSAIIGQMRRTYSIPEGEYFLSVATLEPRKNLKLLIDAFQKFVERYPQFSHTLVMTGKKRPGFDNVLMESVSEETRSRIHFTGFVAEEDLSTLYSGAQTFIFPSLQEGFGLPPLEAMACGVPVIVANATSLPEVVGDAGILVDPYSPDELCQALYTMASEPERRTSLSAKGRIRASGMTWPRATDTLRNTLHAVREQATLEQGQPES